MAISSYALTNTFFKKTFEEYNGVAGFSSIPEVIAGDTGNLPVSYVTTYADGREECKTKGSRTETLHRLKGLPNGSIIRLDEYSGSSWDGALEWEKHPNDCWVVQQVVGSWSNPVISIESEGPLYVRGRAYKGSHGWTVEYYTATDETDKYYWLVRQPNGIFYPYPLLFSHEEERKREASEYGVTPPCERWVQDTIEELQSLGY